MAESNILFAFFILQKHNVLFSLYVYTNKSRPLYSDELLIRQ